MFGKQCLPGQKETMGHREEFDVQALPSFPPTPVYHRKLLFFVFIFGDNSLPGPGPLSKFFWAVKEELKSSSGIFGP